MRQAKRELMKALICSGFGLICGFFVLLVCSPAGAVPGFFKILTGGFSEIADVCYHATPIIMTGLAVGFALKSGLFNIGASGQYTVGMFCALYAGLMFDLTAGVHWVACVLAGAVGGMLWGVTAGLFKAFLRVSEVITAIMLNYIGMHLVDMLVRQNEGLYAAAQTRTEYLPASAQLPSLGVAGSSLSIAFLLAIVIAVGTGVILNRTTFGYELRVMGLNRHAGEHTGMSSRKTVILTMAVSGALAGLGGAFAILAPSTIPGSSMIYEPIGVITTIGFHGIAAALLGNGKPFGILAAALFFSHLQRGGTLASLYGYTPEVIDIVIAVILYASAFAGFLREKLWKKEE